MTKNILCLFGCHQLKTINRSKERVYFEWVNDWGEKGLRYYYIYTIISKCKNCGKEFVKSYKVLMRGR